MRSSNLVTRLALGGLAAFILVAAASSIFVVGHIRQKNEEEAVARARFLVDSVLMPVLRKRMVNPPVSDGQAERLSRIVGARMVDGSAVVRVKVWDREGTVLFSDEGRIVGRAFPSDEGVREAFEGRVVGGVSELRHDENQYEDQFGKLHETYVPLDFTSDDEIDAVVEIYQDYAWIQQDINDHLLATLPFFVPLVAGLGLLYLLLLPLARRVVRTLAGQNTQLEAQAAELQKHLHREQRTVAELKRLNQMKGEFIDFISVASHELRTPVTAVIGALKPLEKPEAAEDPELRRELLRIASEHGESLLRLANSLLTISSPEDLRVEISTTSFSFKQAVDEVIADLDPAPRRIRVAIDDGLPNIQSDRHLVKEILRQLLENALKFSPEDLPVRLDAGR
ncbi:MAG: sensor histidine kinase, partial [Actinomycetota bacterium]